ncbi:MAG: family 2 glycosyl transferase [Verrucomicrobia bacterium]|nr:family 2 glycosyl transferase [Leptolyngbya sp. ES-bin-22]
MLWEVCIRYPNGQERALRSFRNREVALKRVDAIYSDGYPMHVAYVVRPAQEVAFSGQLAAVSL